MVLCLKLQTGPWSDWCGTDVEWSSRCVGKKAAASLNRR